MLKNIPNWVGQYVGLPYKDHGRDRSGLDCWGLVKLVLLEQFAVAVPDYGGGYDHAHNARNVHTCVTNRLADWRRTTRSLWSPGDVVLLRIGGAASHTGIWIGHTRMLHIHSKINAVVESVDGHVWCKRILGGYKYAG